LTVPAPERYFIGRRRRAMSGESVEWDSVDVDEPYGPTDAIVVGPEGNERLVRSSSMANTMRAKTTELSLFEMEIALGWEGVSPHSHHDQVDSFYVLDGEVEFLKDGEDVRVGAGTFFAAPLHIEHGFRPVVPARTFTLQPPDAGFAGRVRSR